MKIIIGADHAGFGLKEDVKALLAEKGFEITDAGPFTGDSVDYPDFGIPVAEAVSAGRFGRGILICGSGIGMSIVANRFAGVRAALCTDAEAAKLSREHNDSNILVLAARRTPEAAAREIVSAWLATPFTGGRHAGRLAKIARLEDKLYKS